MGIYYAAVNRDKKEYFEAPGSFANKSPGIFHPKNPFPNMVVMMNSMGHNFEIENDAAWGCYYDIEGVKDITDEVYKKFLEYYPWAKEHYEKDE